MSKILNKENVREMYGKVTGFKMNEDGTLEVIGWASQDNIDSVREIVPVSAIDEAVPEYAEFANIREMHNPFLGGAGVCNILITEIDGIWIKATIVSEDVIKKIITKVYKGFSIGYQILSKYKRADGITILSKIKLFEISVVDRPANMLCLLQNIDKIQEENENNNGGKVEMKTLTIEQKSNMPDESFAFVGTLDGSKRRILPYKDADENVDIELALFSIDTLNANRPEDVKFIKDDDKTQIYNDLVDAVKTIDENASIPELALNNEYGNKFEGTGSMNFDEAFSKFEGKFAEITEQNKENKEEMTSYFKSLVCEIKSFFKSKKEEGSKAITSQNITDVATMEQYDESMNDLYSVQWALWDVLWNIRNNADLSNDDIESLSIKAFNDAKNKYMDAIKAIFEITDSKTINPEEGKNMEKEITVNGAKYALVVEPVVEPETKPKEETKPVDPTSTDAKFATIQQELDGLKSANETLKTEKAELETKSANLETENKDLKAKTTGNNDTDSKNFNGDDKPTDPKDPDFWL